MESEKGVGSNEGPAEFRLVRFAALLGGDVERALVAGLRLRVLVGCVMVVGYVFC